MPSRRRRKGLRDVAAVAFGVLLCSLLTPACRKEDPAVLAVRAAMERIVPLHDGFTVTTKSMNLPEFTKAAEAHAAELESIDLAACPVELRVALDAHVAALRAFGPILDPSGPTMRRMGQQALDIAMRGGSGTVTALQEDIDKARQATARTWTDLVAAAGRSGYQPGATAP